MPLRIAHVQGKLDPIDAGSLMATPICVTGGLIGRGPGTGDPGGSGTQLDRR